MKKLFSILFTCVLSLIAFGQAPNWEWASNANEVQVATEKSICVDGAGNSYVTGYFNWSATFGSITLTSNANGTNPNLYIVKYNPWGGVVWAQNAGGHSGNEGEAVAVDDSENVYLTGYFGDTIIFGSTTLISGSTYGPGYLVKYNSSGNVIWAKLLGTGSGAFGVAPRSLTIDHSGNIFVTGDFQTPAVTFGTITLTSANNGNYIDGFLVKCDPSGNVLWAKMGSSYNGFTKPTSVTTDASGNSYITGWFVSPSLTFGFSTITNNGSVNSFLTRYDPNGNVVWARGFGGSSYDHANSVSSDDLGYTYVTGSMASPSITIGPYTLTNSDTITGNTYDIFLIKFAPNGTVVWATSAGADGIYFEAGNSVVSDSVGNAYLTGYFESPVINFGSTALTCNGGQNIFIVKYDPSGNAIWAKSLGETSFEEGNSIDINQSGDCYVTGYFLSPTITFGSFVLTNPNGAAQFFVAKTGEEAGIHSNETSGNISIFPNPSNGKFQLSGNFPENSEIHFYDLLGKEVGQFVRLNSNEQKINIELDLSDGIYFYRVFTNENIFSSGKFIITD